MHNLLRFIARCSNFLVFIALEVVAFLLIIHNNTYPRSSMLSTANTMVGWTEEKISDMVQYFQLNGANEQLAQENAELRSILTHYTELEEQKEEAAQGLQTAKIRYIPAKVVQMTTNKHNNYLTIDKGSNDGLYKGMGVRNSEGVVGIVSTVGHNYSVVIPIINSQSMLSCRFIKNDYISPLVWDGKDSRYAQLDEVAAHMMVNPEDTIVTSGLSPAFPEKIPVGVVENSELKAGESYHSVRIRLFTNFRRLRYVQVIDNKAQKEIEELNGTN